MIKKDFIKILSVLAAVMALIGCSSDDESHESVEVEVPETLHENIQLNVKNDAKLDGHIKVFLGKWYPCSDDPRYCTNENKNTFTIDDSKYVVSVDVKQLQRTRQKALRNDVFVEGHYSLLDVLLYVSEIRDDLHIELGEFDVAIGTYKFLVSWDINGDGQFTLEGDGAENFQSPDWYPRWAYSSGNFKREIGSATLEAHYKPADELIVNDKTEIRFQSFSKHMTQRREQTQATQVARRDNAGGEIVIPEFQVNFGDGRGYVTLAKDIHVRRFNLRPDLFQPNVYTLADFFMTLHHDYGFNLEFTYWPTLSTKSKVNAFAVTQFEGRAAHGLSGWAIQSGEIASANDFFMGNIKNISVPLDVVMANKDGKFCSWLGDMTEDKARFCKDDWNDIFGGNKIHLMSDQWVINSTPELVQLQWHTVQNGLWGVPTVNKAGDGKYQVYDISQAIAPLNDTHFGWKIADCSQCHSLEKTHLKGDSPILPAAVEPYYCASCHGSNGGPNGHGESARCSWCHVEDKMPVNHGEASRKFFLSDIECPDGTFGPCANNDNLMKTAHDAVKNPEKYPTNQQNSSNSLWHTNEQFPGPYSCITCHPNVNN